MWWNANLSLQKHSTHSSACRFFLNLISELLVSHSQARLNSIALAGQYKVVVFFYTVPHCLVRYVVSFNISATILLFPITFNSVGSTRKSHDVIQHSNIQLKVVNLVIIIALNWLFHFCFIVVSSHSNPMTCIICV